MVESLITTTETEGPFGLRSGLKPLNAESEFEYDTMLLSSDYYFAALHLLCTVELWAQATVLRTYSYCLADASECPCPGLASSSAPFS